MSVAYRSQNLSFPLERLMKWLLYNNMSDVVLDCEYYNIDCDKNNKTIRFSGRQFNLEKKMVRKSMWVITNLKFRAC